MVDVDTSIDRIKRALEAKAKLLEKAYYQELRNQLRSEKVIKAYQDAVIKRFGEIQAGYFNKGVDDDPTRPLDPENIEAVNKEVRDQLIQTADSFKDGEELKITILSDKFLGLDTGGPKDTKDPHRMKWLYYFVSKGGLKSNFYWVNMDSYEKLFHKSSEDLGRFGDGFLLKPERGSKLEQKLKEKGIPLHPQSGKPGNPDLLKGITREIDFRSLVTIPALDAAKKKFKQL